MMSQIRSRDNYAVLLVSGDDAVMYDAFKHKKL